MLLHSRSVWIIRAIPLYLWCILLLPSAMAAIYVVVRRRWRYLPIPLFALTNVLVASAGTLYTIFVLNRFDAKFREAPNAAFEIDLFGDAAIALIGFLLFGSSLAYFGRRGRRVTTSSILTAALSGAVYATLPQFLHWFHIQPLILWIWILLMPEAAAAVTIRKMEPDRLSVDADVSHVRRET